MEWDKVNVKPERLNGLKLEAAIRSRPPTVTSVTSLVEYILEEFGIKLLNDQQLESEAERLGVEIQ